MGDSQALASGTVRLAGETWDQCCYTYRFYSLTKPDEVIYVGMADNVLGRIRSHLRHSEWARHADRVEWDLLPTREIAGKHEWKLIRKHRPRYNVEMNGDDFYAEVAS